MYRGRLFIFVCFEVVCVHMGRKGCVCVCLCVVVIVVVDDVYMFVFVLVLVLVQVAKMRGRYYPMQVR